MHTLQSPDEIRLGRPIDFFAGTAWAIAPHADKASLMAGVM